MTLLVPSCKPSSGSTFTTQQTLSEQETQVFSALEKFFGPFLSPFLFRPEHSIDYDEIGDSNIPVSGQADLITTELQGSEFLRLSGFGQNVSPAGSDTLADAFVDLTFQIIINGAVRREFKRFQVGRFDAVADIYLPVTQGSKIIVRVKNADAVNAHTAAVRLIGWTF